MNLESSRWSSWAEAEAHCGPFQFDNDHSAAPPDIRQEVNSLTVLAGAALISETRWPPHSEPPADSIRERIDFFFFNAPMVSSKHCNTLVDAN